MAGKHRKSTGKRRESSRGGSPARRGLVPGLMGAALGATTMSTALMTGTTATVAAPAVMLAALITPANSTSQIFAGTTYYGTNQTTVYGDQVVVPFFLGPQGIVDAVGSNTDPNSAIFASGWGAGQTGTALAIMEANNDPALSNIKLVVLDNNTNRAGGGFWTTYWMFAPLLLTSAEPTPTDVSVPVVDVAYEYNINSNAPTYPLNPFASANTLVAYVYGYGGEQTAPVPQEALDAKPTDAKHYHYVVAEDGTVISKTELPPDVKITYVTFKSDRLPLVKPLLLVPGGEILADALEPTLTELVNAGYQDGEPIPKDPSVPRPVGLFPPAEQTTGLVQRLPGTATQGAEDAQADLSSPSGSLTNPLSSATNNAPSLPKLPKLPTPLLRGPIDMTGGNKATTGSSTGSTSSTSGTNPVRKAVESISSAVNDVADGLRNAAKKDDTADTP